MTVYVELTHSRPDGLPRSDDFGDLEALDAAASEAGGLLVGMYDLTP